MNGAIIRFLQLFVLILSISNVCIAQMNWEEYYPLHVGNLWEFLDFESVPMTLTRRVLSDTVMPNGKRYAVIEEYYHDGPHPGRSGRLQFERIDSFGNVYAYVPVTCKFPTEMKDTLIYRLAGSIGDSVMAVCRLPETRWEIVEKGTTIFFDQEAKYSRIELSFDVVRGVKTFVQNFGLIYYGYEGGERTLRGAIINGKKHGDITVSVEKIGNSIVPYNTHLYQNFPNPFNNETTIVFALPRSIPVELCVYDVTGKRMRTLLNNWYTMGEYSISWDGKDDKGIQLPSGVYFIVLRAGEGIRIQKAAYLK